MKIQRPRGTQDYLGESYQKRYELKNKFVDFYLSKGYQGIETPVFEQRDLFVRSVGEETDIVQKELFDLEKKSDEVYSLRPEFTAGIIRALIEAGIKSMPLPVKVIATGPCFRYERPQKGRKRQFDQLDNELIGKKSPEIDAKYVAELVKFLSEAGVTNLTLNVNDFGSIDSRTNFAKALSDYLKTASGLCELCQERVKRNPLRVLDCKNEACKNAVSGGPKMRGYVSSSEKQYFNDFLKFLKMNSNVEVIVDDTLVRGLDYYTGIVFEFNIKGDESRMSSIGGGGRYDDLIRELGGPDLPAIGCGLGLDRIAENLE
jgi:histidyl-tRNA synthetase